MVCRVASFPSLTKLQGNPYWSLLKESLEKIGVDFVPHGELVFGRRWLWQHRNMVDTIHFHYMQQFYAYEYTHARLRWVIRLATNLILARILDYRTVFTLHNLTPTFPLLPSWVDYLGHWAMVNLSERVIVHCQYARESLKKYYGRQHHVSVIAHPNFIGYYPNTTSRTEARLHLGLDHKNKAVLFFGGIRPNKGIESLVEAFQSLPGENLRLLIVGDPFPPHYLAQVKNLVPDERIIWHTGFIADENVHLYFQAADVVTLPFASILTSSSTILAMSFGRPVIVPAMGCLPELVNSEVGLLYEPNDNQSLVHALEQSLLSDLEKLGVNAYARVSRLKWDQFAQDTLQVYMGKT